VEQQKQSPKFDFNTITGNLNLRQAQHEKEKTFEKYRSNSPFRANF